VSLFKYEKVRLLSTRAKQLSGGAKPMIKDTTGLSSKEIALLELKNKMIPLIIERPIPNIGIERWKLSELEIMD
jgi:DNA-directed RNA polymerase subunit K/omega